jgi:hypothetical protein
VSTSTWLLAALSLSNDTSSALEWYLQRGRMQQQVTKGCTD